MKKIPTVIMIGLLCLSIFPLLSPSVHASVVVMPTRLPEEITAAASLWDGTNAYIFGGAQYITGPVNHILRYNPSTDSISSMSAVLPDPVCDMPAVWAGQYAYVFGGYVAHLHTSDNIVRYDPATDAITVMGAKLPNYAFPLYSMSAVWDGNYAYLFGGYDGYSYYDTVLRYDPASDQLTSLSAKLPTGMKWNSAVWNGTHAFIFGGRTPFGASDQILRYDPASDSITPMSAKLPLGILVSSAVWAGTSAYIFGGCDISNQPQGSILRYDPTSDSIETVESLPSSRRFTCAVWDGSSAYVFGGDNYDTGSDFFDEIVRFSPAHTEISVDIKPGSWPNPINVNSEGMLTVAICGTEDFEVMTIDPASVKMYAEGIEQGVSLLRWSFEDVATPYVSELGGGHELKGDGIIDLVLHFRTQETVTVLTLAGHGGETLPLTIKGNLKEPFGGTPFQGQDYVWIITPTPRELKGKR